MHLRLPPALLVCVFAFAARTAANGDSPLLPVGAKLEKLAGGFTHAEGPLWHPAGYLLFGDTPSDRVLRCDEGGAVAVFRAPCGRTTGLALDPSGRLIANESHGGPEGGR